MERYTEVAKDEADAEAAEEEHRTLSLVRCEAWVVWWEEKRGLSPPPPPLDASGFISRGTAIDRKRQNGLRAAANSKRSPACLTRRHARGGEEEERERSRGGLEGAPAERP